MLRTWCAGVSCTDSKGQAVLPYMETFLSNQERDKNSIEWYNIDLYHQMNSRFESQCLKECEQKRFIQRRGVGAEAMPPHQRRGLEVIFVVSPVCVCVLCPAWACAISFSLHSSAKSCIQQFPTVVS